MKIWKIWKVINSRLRGAGTIQEAQQNQGGSKSPMRSDCHQQSSKTCDERSVVVATAMAAIPVCARRAITVIPSKYWPGDTKSRISNLFHDFPDLSGETSNLKNYYLLEASKYNCLSKCSARGYYILRKSCIV